MRNIQALRLRLAAIVLAAFVSLATISIAFDFWTASSNPGSLSQHHSSFGEDNCASCHTVADIPRTQWLKRAVKGPADDRTDSQNCVSCHAFGKTPQNPHSLSDLELRELTSAAQENLSESGGIKTVGQGMVALAQKLRSHSAASTMACNTCHTEHLGSAAEITSIDDQQCAVCHKQSFSDFANHAAFSDYPASSRTPIIFSHVSHLQKHFHEEESLELAPTACTSCHISDAAGKSMQIKGFDETCSGCHEKQIKGRSRAAEKGVALMSFPAVDMASLKQRGVDIGEWPESSDAEFTPLNWLLVIAGEPDLAAQYERFQGIDLYDLGTADEDQLRLVHKVFWNLKQVFYEMRQGGAEAILRRLVKTPGRSGRLSAAAVGLLPPELIDASVNEALPGLSAEMQGFKGGRLPAFNISTMLPGASEQQVFTAQSTLQNNQQANRQTAEQESTEDGAGGEDNWLTQAVANSDDPADVADEDDWFSTALEEDAATSDDEEALFGDDDLSGDELFAEEMDEDSASLFEEDEVRVSAEQDSQVSRIPSERLSLEDRASAGGWYYEAYVFRYRPAGHADALLVSWMNFMQFAGNATARVRQSMIDTIMGENSPGSCAKCHSIDLPDTQHSQVQKIHWTASRSMPQMHDFNRFSHGSHFGVVANSLQFNRSGDSNGCGFCHQLNDEADSSMAYTTQAGNLFQSDFFDLDQPVCIECHEPGTALAECTQCHNFHVGDRNLFLLTDNLDQSP